MYIQDFASIHDYQLQYSTSPWGTGLVAADSEVSLANADQLEYRLGLELESSK